MKRLPWLLAACLFVSCRQERIIYPVEPYIEFRSISPKEISDFGSAQIELYYRDGDGDLGGIGESATNPDLIIEDLRNPTLFPEGYDGKLYYNLPQLIKENRPISIQGTMQITLPEIARLNPAAPRETLIFSIYLIDRAGHKSNIIFTEPIFIVSR
ncbi:MAG: hypothetical protein ACUVRD_00660 [Bacteroidia bacterium]